MNVKKILQDSDFALNMIAEKVYSLDVKGVYILPLVTECLETIYSMPSSQKEILPMLGEVPEDKRSKIYLWLSNIKAAKSFITKNQKHNYGLIDIAKLIALDVENRHIQHERDLSFKFFMNRTGLVEHLNGQYTDEEIKQWKRFIFCCNEIKSVYGLNNRDLLKLFLFITQIGSNFYHCNSMLLFHGLENCGKSVAMRSIAKAIMGYIPNNARLVNEYGVNNGTIPSCVNNLITIMDEISPNDIIRWEELFKALINGTTISYKMLYENRVEIFQPMKYFIGCTNKDPKDFISDKSQRRILSISLHRKKNYESEAYIESIWHDFVWLMPKREMTSLLYDSICEPVTSNIYENVKEALSEFVNDNPLGARMFSIRKFILWGKAHGEILDAHLTKQLLLEIKESTDKIVSYDNDKQWKYDYVSEYLANNKDDIDDNDSFTMPGYNQEALDAAIAYMEQQKSLNGAVAGNIDMSDFWDSLASNVDVFENIYRISGGAYDQKVIIQILKHVFTIKQFPLPKDTYKDDTYNGILSLCDGQYGLQGVNNIIDSLRNHINNNLNKDNESL